MSAIKRFENVMYKKLPDRVPFVPKIWVDLASNITEVPYIEIINDPELAMRTVVEAGIKLNIDAVRLFIFPTRKVTKHGQQFYQIDRDGKRIGAIDLHGGWGTRFENNTCFDISNEEMVANYNFWHTREPVIKNKADAKCIKVPSASFYEESGYGNMVKKMLTIANDKTCCIGDCNSGTLTFYAAMRGFNHALFDFIENPSLVHECMEKGIQISIERAKFFINHGIKILRYNDSIANMSVISPEHWRKFIYPYLKMFSDEVHKYDNNARIYCHICGNVLPIVNTLVESGFDCIAPLDPLGGFNISNIREKTGDEMTLMGGINTLSFVQSTPSEIMEEAKICIEQGGKSGNFILGSGCMIPRSSKVENIQAVVIAAESYGLYKNGSLVRV